MCFLMKKWSISLDPPLLHNNSFRKLWCTSSLLVGLILMRVIYLQVLEHMHKTYISNCHGILDSGLWIVSKVERVLLTKWQTPLVRLRAEWHVRCGLHRGAFGQPSIRRRVPQASPSELWGSCEVWSEELKSLWAVLTALSPLEAWMWLLFSLSQTVSVKVQKSNSNS